MFNKQNYSTASVSASILNSLFIKGFITTKLRQDKTKTISLISQF